MKRDKKKQFFKSIDVALATIKLSLTIVSALDKSEETKYYVKLLDEVIGDIKLIDRREKQAVALILKILKMWRIKADLIYRRRKNDRIITNPNPEA